jgi:hypothetical protein
MQRGYIITLSNFVSSINYPINSPIVHESYSTDVLNATEPSLYSAKRLFKLCEDTGGEAFK